MSSNEDDTAVSKVGPEAPPAAEHDCLIVMYRREGAAGARVPLDLLPLRIGRDNDNELVLDEEGISRRHARIERRDGRVVAMDTSSTNGTLLNGVELATIAELKTGDQLTIGSTNGSAIRSMRNLPRVDQLCRFEPPTAESGPAAAWAPLH